MSGPSGLQWESVIWILVLGLLFWELRRLRASQRAVAPIPGGVSLPALRRIFTTAQIFSSTAGFFTEVNF